MNTGVSCHVLLQGFFLTEGSSPGSLLGRQVFYHEVTWIVRPVKKYVELFSLDLESGILSTGLPW